MESVDEMSTKIEPVEVSADAGGSVIDEVDVEGITNDVNVDENKGDQVHVDEDMNGNAVEEGSSMNDDFAVKEGSIETEAEVTARAWIVAMKRCITCIVIFDNYCSIGNKAMV